MARNIPNRVRLFLATILIVASGLMAYSLPRPNWAFDFYNYWITAHAVAQTPSIDIYDFNVGVALADQWKTAFASADERIQRAADFRVRITLELTATPLYYVLTSLFVGSDFVADYQLFVIVQIMMFVISCLILLRELEVDWIRALSITSVALITMAQLHRDLDFGNGAVFFLFFATLFLALHARNRPLLAWVLAGSILWLKPNFLFVPLPIMVFAFRERNWAALKSSILGSLLGSVLSLAISYFYWRSWAPWQHWFSAVLPRMITRPDLTTQHYNVSPLQIVAQTTGWSPVFLSLAFACSWIFILLRLPAPPKHRGHVYELAIGALGMLLVPKLVWVQYQLLAVPAILLLIVGWKTLTRRQAWLFVTAVAGIQIDPEWMRGAEFTFSLFNCGCAMTLFGLVAATGSNIKNRSMTQA